MLVRNTNPHVVDTISTPQPSSQTTRALSTSIPSRDAPPAPNARNTKSDPADDFVVPPIDYVTFDTETWVGEWKSRIKHLKREATEVETSMQRKETLHGSQKVVALAITSNLIMFSGKMFSALQSGSASMFAEALHSLADVCNECLLMWGIFRSLRQSDSLHPYGFSREKYAWALVSGVGVFFLGGGVSLYHGISGLLAGHHIVGDVSLAWWVLGGSLLFEGATMTYALKQIARSAKANGVGVLDFIKRGADPTTVQILLEDCAAVAGVAIAGTSLMLSKWLDSPMIDNLGSITIGLLLSSVATFLIQRNIASLVETSMAPERQNVIVRILESDPVVKSVHDVKTTTVGTDWVRFKAEILFNGEEITRRYMSRTPNSLRKDIDELRTLETDEQIEEWIVQHGKGIISTLATEVDRLELNIMSNHPEIKHVDLEIL